MEQIPITDPTVIVPSGKDVGTVKRDDKLSMSPNTTEQQDLIMAGQRHINLMWETTQSRIALVSVFVGMIINSALLLTVVVIKKDITTSKVAVISNCLGFINLTVGIVIGFYFSRTNHTKVGGIGADKNAER